jgi:hypothetical protein
MSLQFSYHFTRGDYVALSEALLKRSISRRLMRLALWLALMAGVLSISGWLGGMPLADIPTILSPKMAGGIMPNWFAGLMALLAITLVWPEWLIRLAAYFSYKRMAFADQDYLVELNDDGVHIRTDGASSQIDWARMLRVIETRKHVILAVGARQGACLPLRALPPGTDKAAVIAYVKTRAKPDLPHVT